MAICADLSSAITGRSVLHVVIMDEDCGIEGLDMGAFLDDMHRAGVQIGSLPTVLVRTALTRSCDSKKMWSSGRIL